MDFPWKDLVENWLLQDFGLLDTYSFFHGLSVIYFSSLTSFTFIFPVVVLRTMDIGS